MTGSARCDSKEPPRPHGDARPPAGTGPGAGGAPRGGGRGIPGTARGERLSNGRGRTLRTARVAGSAGTRGSPGCVSLGIPPAPRRARAPGARSLNSPLKLAFGGMLWAPGPDVSAIQFQSAGDGAPQPRCVAGDRDGAGLRASLAGVFRGPRSRMCVR